MQITMSYICILRMTFHCISAHHLSFTRPSMSFHHKDVFLHSSRMSKVCQRDCDLALNQRYNFRNSCGPKLPSELLNRTIRKNQHSYMKNLHYPQRPSQRTLLRVAEDENPDTDTKPKHELPSEGLPVDSLKMFFVAALWGTNPVALRYVYRLAQPPAPAALAALQSSLGAVLLTGLTLYSEFPKSSNQNVEPDAYSSDKLSSDIEDPTVTRGQGFNIDNVRMAGIETGMWTFAANAATISAFQMTPVSRGAFLLRLTAVFTPAVSKLLGNEVSNREWIGCVAALLGGILISLDSASASGAGSDSGFGSGEILMIVSACIWAVQTVRLSVHAQRFDALQLARNQTLTFASFSVLWLAGLWLTASPENSPIGSLFDNSTSPVTLAAAFWPAIGPWGFATALQVAYETNIQFCCPRVLRILGIISDT